MRGRWDLRLWVQGAGVARYRAEGRAQQEIQSQQQANQIEMEKMKTSYQHEIDQLKAQQRQTPQPQHPSGGRKI